MARITHGDTMHRDPTAAAHIADTADAHAASSISVLDTGGNFTGTDVEAVLAEIDAAIAGGGHAEDHASRHELGGADEIDVTGLTGAGGGGGGRVIGNLQSIIEEECFVATGLAPGVGVVAANTGGSGVTAGQAGHPGILFLHTGTNAAGRAVAITGNLATHVLLAASIVRFGLIGKIFNGISDGTDRYTLRLGLGDVSTGEHTDGVFFRQVDNVNGGEWEGVCRSNGTETVLDTNVAPDGNWHTWEFEVNDAATSVEFFIDGTSVGTITTNIPTGTGRETTFSPAGIIKSLGTNRRDFFVDAYWYHFDFTTPR